MGNENGLGGLKELKKAEKSRNRIRLRIKARMEKSREHEG